MNGKGVKEKNNYRETKEPDSSVDVAMGHRWTAGVLFPARLRDFLHSFQTDSGAHPVPGFPGVKAAKP
jgi:hypothetical protein